MPTSPAPSREGHHGAGSVDRARTAGFHLVHSHLVTDVPQHEQTARDSHDFNDVLIPHHH